MKIRRSMIRKTTAGNTTDWRALLRAAVDGDADADAEALAPKEVLAMRRTVVAAARDTSPDILWQRPLAIAATVLLMIGMGAAAGRRFEMHEPAAVVPAEQARPAGGGQLQLQFATPGGTRIIWVFNSELDLKATMP
jgi:hypothetical protein